MAFCRSELELAEVQSDGSTLRTHLENLKIITGNTAQRLLEAPELPESCLYVWSWFIKLSACRGSNGFGPSALSYSELRAFFEMEGITPEPWEVNLLKAFDNCYMQHAHEHAAKQNKTKKSPSGPSSIPKR